MFVYLFFFIIYRTLEYLFRNKWLDDYTRTIFVEFTVYNANVNLFCIVTLLLETAAVGKVKCFLLRQRGFKRTRLYLQAKYHESTKTVPADVVGAFQFVGTLQTVRLYQSTGGLHVFVMAAEIIYMIFILYYMFVQVSRLAENGFSSLASLNTLVFVNSETERLLNVHVMIISCTQSGRCNIYCVYICVYM